MDRLLKRLDAICGVILGLAGVFALFHPGGVPTFFGASANQPDPALSRIEAQAKATAPRLVADYAFFDSQLSDVTLPSGGPRDAISNLAFPVIENDVLGEFRKKMRAGGSGFSTAGCAGGGGARAADSLAFLVIQNRGRRDANGVRVDLDRLLLASTVPVNEAGGDDYVTKLRGAATSLMADQVRVPFVIGPGEGVRVPLWANYGSSQFDRWCVLSRSAYLPRVLTYTDPQLGSLKKAAVRRLEDPSVIANGVVGRG